MHCKWLYFSASKLFFAENQVQIGSTFIVNVDKDFGAKIELFQIVRAQEEAEELSIQHFNHEKIYNFWDSRAPRINFIFGYFFLEPFLILPEGQKTTIFCLLDETCDPLEISHRNISQISELSIINYDFPTGVENKPEATSILYPEIRTKVPMSFKFNTSVPDSVICVGSRLR